ncbi:RNA polymerase sigma factor [Rhodopseudomonas palustris]|uniref:Sigma-24 (FecI-like) n=1 Tax=Rhodopseudomonas palustris (strain BisB18) TaxID=316056 RepID=Q217A1_RHOPB
MLAVLNNVFLHHRKSLMWSAMRIVRDAQAAEDVAHETYLRARKAIEAGPIDHIEAFLHQTARNLAIDHLRRKKLRGSFERNDHPDTTVMNVPANVPSPEDALIQRERLKLLDQALAQLPKRAQSVWILSRVRKWPYPRIAEHLGVSQNTVFNDLKLAVGHCHDALARIDRR